MVDREKQHPLMIVLFLLLEKLRSGVAFFKKHISSENEALKAKTTGAYN